MTVFISCSDQASWELAQLSMPGTICQDFGCKAQINNGRSFCLRSKKTDNLTGTCSRTIYFNITAIISCLDQASW